MDAFHPRRVDEDLEHRPRSRQIRDPRGIELEREIRLRPAVPAALEVVRPQHRHDHAQEAPDDSVLVEAGDRIESRLDLADEAPDLGLRVRGLRRFEAAVKQLDEQARELRVARDGLLHVRLAEHPARLAQVLGDRAQQRDLAPGQLGSEHEPVEAVVLDRAAPHLGERVLEHLTDSIRLELDSFAAVQAEVVDPHGRPLDGCHLERPLVGDLDAHVLEQRQHIGQEDRLPRAQQLEREVTDLGAQRPVEAHVQVAFRVETLDPFDVGHRCASREIVAVGGGERVPIAPEQRGATLLAKPFDERVLEVVGPRTRRLGDLGLDRREIVVADRSRNRVDDEVQPRKHRLRDACTQVDAGPAERPQEYLLDPLADVGVVSLERQVDEARQEAPERVAADEEADAATLAEVEDPERDLVELVRRRSGRARRADTSRGSRSAPCSRGSPGESPLRSTTCCTLRRRTGISPRARAVRGGV